MKKTLGTIGMIDMGKTTLSAALKDEPAGVEFFESEQERGITIVTCPGHEEIAGRVVEAARMADKEVLVVGAGSLPSMAQTLIEGSLKETKQLAQILKEDKALDFTMISKQLEYDHSDMTSRQRKRLIKKKVRYKYKKK